MKFKLLVFFIFTISTSSAQFDQSIWGTLSMVKFEKQYDEMFGMEVEKAVVSPLVQSLDGTEIEVEGYIIPLQGKLKQNHFMLSVFPANMCFFCGKAGPESAMEVYLANDKKIAYTEQKVKVKGTLRINAADVTSLLYTLENAVEL